MNIFFSKNMINESESSHNILASSAAAFNHDIRYYSGTGGKVFFYGEEGVQSTSEEIRRSARRVFIDYDGIGYDTYGIHDVITFGHSGKYPTYPVRHDFSSIGRLDQTVSFGRIRNESDIDRYVDALSKSDYKIILANIGKKTYISDIATVLSNKGKSVDIVENHSAYMLETYLRTSKRMVHFGSGIGFLHAVASLFSLHDGAEYITDSDISEPTDLLNFMKSEGLCQSMT